MSKIVIGSLALAAFIYAGWLVFCRRKMPELSDTTGVKRRFLLAVMLFYACLAGCGERSQPTCYKPMAPLQPGTVQSDRSLKEAFRAAWLALDPKQGKQMRQQLDEAISAGIMDKDTALLVELAYKELASHVYRTRGDGAKMTCYDMTQLGGQLYTTRENAYKQLELLDTAEKKGKLDQATVAKARQVVARELEMMQRANALWQGKRDWKDEKSLIDEYKSGKFSAGGNAKAAADVIVSVYTKQPVPKPNAAPAKVGLPDTAKTVWLTLDDKKGEEFRQELDKAVKSHAVDEHVAAVLKTAYQQITYHKMRVKGGKNVATCYRMSWLGSTAATSRDKALKQLELLEKTKAAGTLSDDVIEKAKTVLAKEMEFLSRNQAIPARRRPEEGPQLIKAYQKEDFPVSDTSKQAADLVVGMYTGEKSK